MKQYEATHVVALLAAHYDVPAWTALSLEVFERLIEDLDSKQAEDAALAWMRTNNRRPYASDIRLLVTKMQLGAALEPEEAWEYVIQCVRKVGGYRKFPQKHYPLVARAVTAMGWNTICESTNQVADRAHFMRIYGGMLNREIEAAQRNDGAALLIPPDNQQLTGEATAPGHPLLELIGKVGGNVG